MIYYLGHQIKGGKTSLDESLDINKGFKEFYEESYAADW